MGGPGSFGGPTFNGLVREAVLHPLVGWDFRWIEGRVTRGELPWNYTEMVRERAGRSPDLLDLGTGGGEWLAQFDRRPARTVATEAYPPNVPVAGGRLAPLGIALVRVQDAGGNAAQEARPSSAALPFRDRTFHLIVGRHESYVPSEVSRVLAPGGRFLTQQVGDSWGQEWYRMFRRSPPRARSPPWDLALARRQLERSGLEVLEGREGSYETRFRDIGALVWFLRATPWTLPGFSVDRDVAVLRELHERIRRDAGLLVRMSGFYVEARRPRERVPRGRSSQRRRHGSRSPAPRIRSRGFK